MLYQPIKFNTDLIEENKSSLPSVIEFAQNVQTWDGKVRDRVGSLGKYNFAYSITFDDSFSIDRPGSGIIKLKKMLLNRYVIKISRKEIFDSFWVYEIPDVGAKALTVGFNDFDVECYNTGGRKIFSGIIAILKSFTTKRAYILVDKEYVRPTSGTSNPMSLLTVIIEPKLYHNPDNKKDFNIHAYLKPTIVKENGLLSFYINNNPSNNLTNLYSNDPLDYDVCVKDKENNIYYKLNQSSYSLNIKSGFEYIKAYTNFQTNSGRDETIEYNEPNTNYNFVYHGDYFRQVMTAFAQKLALAEKNYFIFGGKESLDKNLLKYLPIININGENVQDSLIIELEVYANIDFNNVYLLSKQFKKKYNVLKHSIVNNVVQLDISEFNIYKYEDFEIFYYPLTSNGIQRYTGEKLDRVVYSHNNYVDKMNPIKELNLFDANSFSGGFFELKYNNDNKRLIDIYLMAQSDSVSFNIQDYLYNKKIYRYYIDTTKSDIRCYINGLYQDFTLDDLDDNVINISSVSAGNKIQIQIRDFYHNDDYLTTAPENHSTLEDVIDITFSESDIEIIDDTTNIMDLGLNLYEHHELSSMEKYYLTTNEIFLNRYDIHYENVAESENGGGENGGGEIGYNIIDEKIIISDVSNLGNDNIYEFTNNIYNNLLNEIKDKSKEFSQNLFKYEKDINEKLSEIKTLYDNIARNSDVESDYYDSTGEVVLQLNRNNIIFIHLKFGSPSYFSYKVYDSNNKLVYYELKTPSSVNNTGVILPYPFDFSDSDNGIYNYKISSSSNFKYRIFGGQL